MPNLFLIHSLAPKLRSDGIRSIKQIWCNLCAPFGAEHRRNCTLSMDAGRTRMSGGVGRAVSNDRPYPIYRADAVFAFSPMLGRPRRHSYPAAVDTYGLIFAPDSKLAFNLAAYRCLLSPILASELSLANLLHSRSKPSTMMSWISFAPLALAVET